MDEPLPPAPHGISDDEWAATPPAVRVLVVALLQRLQTIEARLNQTSQNSSKPPSSDLPSAPPRPPKVARGRQAGG
jgi:transposase